MTCLACAQRGHATRTGSMFIRRPVAGTPRLAGQTCAYSEGDIWAHVEAARTRLQALESLHAWAHAKAEEAAYWDAAGNPDRAGAVHGYASQRGRFAAELRPVLRGESDQPTADMTPIPAEGEHIARGGNAMSDLISREATKLDRQIDAYFATVTDEEFLAGLKRAGFKLEPIDVDATDELATTRAMPSVGTCATCGWWDNPGICRPRHGECHRWQHSTQGGYRCLLTPPDHYCAVYKRREA